MTALASDHAGYELKESVKKHLEAKGVNVIDCGAFSAESVDYPIMATAACEKVLSGACRNAVLCCGTGIGISIAANKFKGIRAALCHEETGAEYARRHNDANVLCLGGRIMETEKCLRLVDVFLSAPFEGGRHRHRLDLIRDIENGQ